MKPLDERGEEIPASQILPVDPPTPHGADCLPDGQIEICAWCSLPAIEQVLVGMAGDSTGSRPRWAWLCDQCGRQSDRDREASRAT